MTKKTSQFNTNYVWWALGIALFAGFAVGAHVATVIGFNFPLGIAFYSYIQLHGYMQLMGWVGLLIIGISLFFMPRLIGQTLTNPKITDTILKFIVTGLLLRFFSNSVLAYLLDSPFYYPVAILTAIGALLVFTAILFYISVLVSTFRKAGQSPKGLQDIQLFFKTAISGWFIYPALICILNVVMIFQRSVTINMNWNEFATHCFIFLTLIPITFAFSVRIFPLYLKLPIINWNVTLAALAYLLSVCLQLLPMLFLLLLGTSDILINLSQIGSMLKGIVILSFIRKLGFFKQRQLTNAKSPMIEAQRLFGKFNWLIYSAYAWLALGAFLEVMLATAFLLKIVIPISSDALRHIYLLGFVTSLIFGVSVRMIPGFIKQKQIAKPGLVAVTFWLLNITILSRVLPLIMPPSLLGGSPIGGQIAYGFFGMSGVLGIMTLTVLWLNLKKTACNPD